MKTTLDTISWSKELGSGNAEFVEVANPVTGNTIYVVSQVRADNTFVVLKSNPVPPEPGPGNGFTEVAKYTFQNPNKSFDPVAWLDGTTLHIAGTADNVNGKDVDLLKFRFDIETDTLSAPTTVVTGSYIRDSYDICTVNGLPFIAVAVTDPHEPSYPNKHALLGINLNEDDTVGTVTALETSTIRGGISYGAVSVVVDNSVIEVYYEAFPKSISFKDVTYEIRQKKFDTVWQDATILRTFEGRQTDNRMTVIKRDDKRYLAHVYFNQVTRLNALVGNLILGYFDGTQWNWHTAVASTHSILQATLSVSNTKGVYVSYIAQPVYPLKGAWDCDKKYIASDRVSYYATWQVDAKGRKWYFEDYRGDYIALASVKSATTPDTDTVNWAPAPTAWPLHVGQVNTDALGVLDIPGFYNNAEFTWLRGCKTILDDDTAWAVVGETVRRDGIAPTYVSNFNAPPVAILNTNAVTAYRGTEVTLSALQSSDSDMDTLGYVWVCSDSNPAITLTPSGATASLLVDPSIRGAAHEFDIALAVFDSNTDQMQHPPVDITGIEITDNKLTVYTAAKHRLTPDQKVLLYDLSASTFLNVQVVTVGTVEDMSFTADFTHADVVKTTESGHAVAKVNPTSELGQFTVCHVTVPANEAPLVDFSNLSNPIEAERNATITVSPDITGVTDVDDRPVYKWTQPQGTKVEFVEGDDKPSLVLKTNGVDIHGETLQFKLHVEDGVNDPAEGTISVQVAAHDFSNMDTRFLARSTWSGNIASRNTAGTWGALNTSAMLTDMETVKRSPVQGGSSRYVLISPTTITIYGQVDSHTLPLRKILIPDQATIVDAVHTEADFTLVLDSEKRLLRFGEAPLVNTDNPDGIVDLKQYTNMQLTHLFCTEAYRGVRVLAMASTEGCWLAELRDADMTIMGTMELTPHNGFVYGAANVQWIRTANVAHIRSGSILLGTISFDTANIQSIEIINNTLVVKAPNSFTVGQQVSFSNVEQADFLNGYTVKVLTATPTKFTASFERSNYLETSDTGLVTTPNKSYETMIDLSQGQIIGTWDASNLRNQYVTSGEILDRG